MKKIFLAGIVILIAVFAVTCEEAPVAADAEIEYTDVVVSPDGSQITIYLDGATVPVTKAQRAMTKELAMMSYDYLEVFFQNSTGIARSAWELGQTAGISGNGLRIANSNYGQFAGTISATLQYACLFAGKKDGKTLFGVGKLTSSRTKTGTLQANTPINDDTASITFSLAAIQTGLFINGDPLQTALNPGNLPRGSVADSFQYTAATVGTGETAGPASTRAPGISTLQTLSDGVKYPVYQIPAAASTITWATYTFYFITGLSLTSAAYNDLSSTYYPAIIHADPAIDTSKPLVQKRTPRFMDGGRYLQPSGHIDTKTKVAFRGTYPTARAAAFSGVVPLVFTTVEGSGGIFSFYLEIPVHNVSISDTNTTSPTNRISGNEPITWVIRTGLGSDLYSLDDGVSSGGCVFMSTGVSNSDWLDINWVWLP